MEIACIQFCGYNDLQEKREDCEDSAAGADDDEDPPVPMPNTEVKLVCAEDTWMATSRKNR